MRKAFYILTILLLLPACGGRKDDSTTDYTPHSIARFEELKKELLSQAETQASETKTNYITVTTP
jgi:hypothetical protein